MRSLLFTLISLVSSACAYLVLTPGNANGWSTAGPNTVTWQMVTTDPQNFAMLLVNQNQGILPGGQELLAAVVNGSLLTYTVSPPSGGFPVGTGFQVNFVKDAQDTNTILAQSGQFAINQSSTTVSPASTVNPVITPVTVNPTPAASTATDTGNLNPTSSLTNTTAPAAKNSADRIAAAGSTSLIFAALAAFIL